MPKQIKPLTQLLTESYLTKTEISRLLNVPWSVANTVYEKAQDIDNREGIDYYPTKVRLKSVLKVTKLDYSLLEKQIKTRMLQHPQIDDLPKSSSL